MPSRTLPGLGLTGFWDLGFDGWKDPMDVNLRLLSALVQPRAISRTTALPGSPTDGDIYIVPDGAGSNPNEIAIRDNGAWVYVVPAEGFTAYVEDDAENVQFDGTDWVGLAAGIADAPSDGTIYGRKDGAWEAVPDGVTKIELSFFAGGTFDATELLFRHVATQAFTFPAGLTDSRGSSALAATGSAALSIKKNGSEVGTATWSAAGTTATMAMASPTSFAAGDVLSVTGPATPDATLGDVSVSLIGELA